MKTTTFQCMRISKKLLEVATMSGLTKCTPNVRNEQPVSVRELKQERAGDKETGRENDR